MSDDDDADIAGAINAFWRAFSCEAFARGETACAFGGGGGAIDVVRSSLRAGLPPGFHPRHTTALLARNKTVFERISVKPGKSDRGGAPQSERRPPRVALRRRANGPRARSGEDKAIKAERARNSVIAALSGRGWLSAKTIIRLSGLAAQPARQALASLVRAERVWRRRRAAKGQGNYGFEFRLPPERRR